MSASPLLIIVLAAGKGQRMRSRLPKPLHAIGGLSMLGHALRTAARLAPARLAVVIGPEMEAARAEALRHAPAAAVVVQERQAGTADAVLAARTVLAAHQGDVLVVYADTPLLEAATIERLRGALDSGASVAVLGFEARDPAGYGRLITGGVGELLAIREDRDAGPAERDIRLCNAGVIALRTPDPVGLLGRIGNANAKGEYYLTDAVRLTREDGLSAAFVTCPEPEVMGVNSRVELAAAEAAFQQRARRHAMLGGATLIAPDTVWFSYDTVIGQDVTIEPNVFFGPGVVVEDGAHILGNCHIAGARIGTGARVGPFARLRPGAELAQDVHIGNFVEVKNARLHKGAKANHLAYIGDGTVGAAANIGAGTIFCNYDGFNKNLTEVGAGAFIGSNSALVAPVRIGAGAYVAAGSTITKNVAPDALVMERAALEVREGWAAKFRAAMSRRKSGRA